MKIFEFKVDSIAKDLGLKPSILYVAAGNMSEAEKVTSHSKKETIHLIELPYGKIPTDKYFHASCTEFVQYRDLIPGDLVFEQGCLFKLNAVWSAIWDRGDEVVRCDDIYVKDYPGNKNIPGWAMSGVVGAAGKEKATIIKRSVNPYIEN